MQNGQQRCNALCCSRQRINDSSEVDDCGGTVRLGFGCRQFDESVHISSRAQCTFHIDAVFVRVLANKCVNEWRCPMVACSTRGNKNRATGDEHWLKWLLRQTRENVQLQKHRGVPDFKIRLMGLMRFTSKSMNMLKSSATAGSKYVSGHTAKRL